MKKHSKLVLAVILSGSAVIALAQDAAPPANAPVESTENIAPASTAMTTAMAEQMQKMQVAHAKAAAAKTLVERQAAMQEGMKVMKESMAMMNKEPGAMGCMGMPGAKGGPGKGMMGMMMQMMEQQSSMMGMPAPE